MLRKWCLARSNAEFGFRRKIMTYSLLKNHLTQLVLVPKHILCFLQLLSQELLYFLRCFTWDASPKLCFKIKKQPDKHEVCDCKRSDCKWNTRLHVEENSSVFVIYWNSSVLIIYWIRKTLAELGLQLTCSARIGMLQWLIVVDAVCHGTHRFNYISSKKRESFK